MLLRKKVLFLLMSILSVNLCYTYSQGVFFKQTWADPKLNIPLNNSSGRLLRINDKDMSVHEKFAERPEAQSNGLLLIHLEDSLNTIDNPQLYLELWGGHPKNANKRFTLNGKETYMLPDDGAVDDKCVYTYPNVSLKTGSLVTGYNAFQFICDRGETFWGHFIIDEASIVYELKPNNPYLNSYNEFSATIMLNDSVLGNNVEIKIKYPEKFKDSIESVEYFAKYYGYDDNGDDESYEWHGYTYHRKYKNHIGTVTSAPFNTTWNTEMIPTQENPIELKARINLKNGISYWTPIVSNLSFPKDRNIVKLFYCSSIEQPFWTRDHHEKEAIITLPKDISKVEKAQLIVRIWDGGEGTIKEPFKLNNVGYKITTGDAPHEVIYTIADVKVKTLVKEENKIQVVSDTEHHGIEVLMPGPALILKYKK